MHAQKYGSSTVKITKSSLQRQRDVLPPRNESWSIQSFQPRVWERPSDPKCCTVDQEQKWRSKQVSVNNRSRSCTNSSTCALLTHLCLSNGSTPTVGSSRISNLGLCSRAQDRDTLRCWPPLKYKEINWISSDNRFICCLYCSPVVSLPHILSVSIYISPSAWSQT
jgi:hypothetical protein